MTDADKKLGAFFKYRDLVGALDFHENVVYDLSAPRNVRARAQRAVNRTLLEINRLLYKGNN